MVKMVRIKMVKWHLENEVNVKEDDEDALKKMIREIHKCFSKHLIS